MATASAETLKQTHGNETLQAIVATRPLLENLGEELLATNPDRWNVIIGDDAGGRLPAHFVHRLLKEAGRDHATYFVASSKIYRDANGPEPYAEYFAQISSQLDKPLRPLIVTESIATGNTVNFLKETLMPYCDQVPEVATLATVAGDEHCADYAGGKGINALESVRDAFESPPHLSLGRKALQAVWNRTPVELKRAIKSRSSRAISVHTVNETVGIGVDTSSEKPIVSLEPGRDREVSTKAFAFMNAVAKDIASEKLVSESRISSTA